MNNEFSYVVLFTLGLFSSFHCIGMCGGVISALTFGLDQKIRDDKVTLAVYLFAYNFGRLFSYFVAGLIVGYIGTTIVGVIGMSSAHQTIKTFSAIMIILIGLYIAGWFPQFSKIEHLGVKLWKKIQPFGQRLIPVKTPKHAICFGMIWGWLPCGLVYTALLLAALSGNAINAGLGMLAFGLGTVPAVIGTGLISGKLNNTLRKPTVRKLFGFAMIILAVLMMAIPMDHSDHVIQKHPNMHQH